MAAQVLVDPFRQTGPGNLTRPASHQLTPHRRQPHPFGQPLAIHLTAEHAKLDQPEEVLFDPIGTHRDETEPAPIRALTERLTADRLSLHQRVERPGERQTAKATGGTAERAGITDWCRTDWCRIDWCRTDQFRTAWEIALHPTILLDDRQRRLRMAAAICCHDLPMQALLLASASPARRRLLEQAAIAHRYAVSGVDEDAIGAGAPQLTAEQLVQRLARAKAEALAGTGAGVEELVLGCDSVLVFENEVFGKPDDAAEASRRWRRMAGQWAELHTGHCLRRGPAVLAPLQLATVTTRVQFAALSDAEIDSYVATGEPLHCAGGFALEGRGGLLVERIEGCFSNVIGLSLPLLRRWLRAECR